MLDGLTSGEGVGDAGAIVSRTLIRTFCNWSRSIPERMSSDRLPSTNSRFATGRQGDLTRDKFLRDWGKWIQNSRVSNFVGA